MSEDAGALICPACHTVLDERRSELLWCGVCERGYPIVAGIPDLRLRGDQYLDLEGDRAKARRLHDLSDLTFPALVRAYWEMTPEVPSSLADRYAANAVDGARRAEIYLDELGTELAGRRLLDVGCGTGGLVVAAAGRGASVTGVDVALRWLVVAQRQLRGLGIEGRFVAADGAALPFPAGSFDVVTCIETLEHAEQQSALASGLVACIRPGGCCYILTANRFSLAPEPAVRLWGVGMLPRRLAPAYVRFRRGTEYRFRRPLSWRELRNAFHGVGGLIAPGPIPRSSGANAWKQRMVSAYSRLRRVPLLRMLLSILGPFIEVRIPSAGLRRKPDSSPRTGRRPRNPRGRADQAERR